MMIRVLLFASYADALGVHEMPLEVSSGSLVRDVLRRVLELRGTGALPASPLMAVNSEYAALDREVAEGDEVAIIPPVAGG
jgi:molybdopterin synthase catalytic subunit